MSERSFFSTRQTLPGSIFLLVVLMYNAREFLFLFYTEQVQITDSFLGVIIPLLSFIGTVPIGFLISQWWHFCFFILYEIIWTRLDKIPFRELNIRYKLEKNARDLHTRYNYLTSTADNGVKTYLGRRWDLLNTLGASIWAIKFGWIIGMMIKNNVGTVFSLDYVLVDKVVDFIQFTRWECYVTLFLGITVAFMIVGMGRILNHNFHMLLYSLYHRKMTTARA